MRRFLFLLMALGLSVSALMAQTTVSGKVTAAESGEAIEGVAVLVKGTTVGMFTDAEGNYRLEVPDGSDVLLFTYVNRQTVEEKVDGRTTINVAMNEEIGELDEVVVTGYRSFSREKSSSAVSTVGAENITNRPNPSLVQTLSGQVPGLSISTNSGQPGANSVVNIRGVGSINGDTEPLFIIDGAPVDQDNFRSLNPNEIESVTVLKDAAATAIYGNRGANGVIVIETKAGSYNSPLEVTYTYSNIRSTLQDNDYDLMNAPEQLQLENDFGRGRGAGLTDAEIAEAQTTDWPAYFFRTAVGNNHNLQLRKGGANTASYLSIGYLDQEGILLNSSLQRANLRANVTGRSDDQKFNYSANLSLNYSTNNEDNQIGGSGINRNPVLAAYQSVPYISPDDYVDGASLLSPLSFANTPLFIIDRLNTYTFREDELRLISTLSANYEFIDGLSIGIRASGDYIGETLTRSEGPESFNALLFRPGGGANTTPGFQQQRFRRDFLYNQVTNLSYDNTFGKHSISGGVFTEYFRAFRDELGYFAEGLNPITFFPGDDDGFVGDNPENDWFVDDGSANIARAGLFSYFGQADYDYDTRYGISGTIRRDASSRFAETNRWGTFFSVAGRWNIHNEAFADGLPFDLLKLRLSYGTNGNQDLSGEGYFADLNLTRSLYETDGGYGAANALLLDAIGNTDLRWEQIAQSNVGLDFETLRGRLRGSVDAYIKTTTDLFIDLPISAVNAQTNLRANIGSLQNRGVEFQLSYDIFNGVNVGGLLVNVYAIGAYNKQEILDLGAGREEILDDDATSLRVGGPLAEYYIYRYAGVNGENGNALYLDAEGNETEDPDVDGDRVWLGQNIFPDWQGSFGLNVEFKGFYINTQFNYVTGVDRFDFDLSTFQNPNNIGQFRHSRDILDSWSAENPDGTLPALDAGNNTYNLDGTSSRFLTNADFLRLRFINVGYQLPTTLLSRIGMRELSVFASAENLVTFTDWRGFDPEAQSNTSRIYPTPRTITLGVQVGL